MGELPDNIEDAERFKRMFIDPAVDALGSKMEAHLAPLVEGQRQLQATSDKHGERIDRLEGSQNKAMVGWGVFAAGFSIVLTASWDWISRKMGWRV